MQVKQPSVNDLLGKVSASSDMSTRHVRNRYLESTSVGPNAYFRMVVPRVAPNALLDCRNIRMRTTLTLTSSDAGICVDNNQVYPFQRVKISSGTTTLLDIENAALLNSLLYNTTQDIAISDYQKSLIGDGDLATRQGWADAAKEYLFPMWPENTVLRRDGLFDVNSSSDLLLEFWTLTANQYLYSPANDTGATYSLSNIEILSQYIRSDSLAAYFRANATAFTCHSYDRRYETLNSAVSQVKIPSSQTSLNGFLLAMRAVAVEATFNQINKMTVWNANGLVSYNLLINQMRFFDEDISSYEQFFNELSHLFPEAEDAVFFTSAYITTRFPIGIRISAAPEQFRNSITSGVATAALNNEIVLQLTFSGAPAMQRVDTFLQSDIIVHAIAGTRDLQIKL
jgi:hypothetical protein